MRAKRSWEGAGSTVRIAFKTFGCKANSLDTDALYFEAKKRGFEVVGEDERADAYVINSCTVTHHADRDARAQIGRFKRQNPGAVVAVVGCYAQVAKEELLSIPEVDIVVGTAEKFSVLDHFTAAADRDSVAKASGFLPEQFLGSRNARASVKIQDGCNFKCSFCIIPQARGRSISLSAETAIAQVEEASRLGFREVVLTGIHLAHYGWDKKTDLVDLVRKLLEKDTGPRIRLSTLDPFEIPDVFIDWLGDKKRLCPHFHIALQSGSNRILQKMRRFYGSEEFVEITHRIHNKNKDTFIGVDVIVGFPGEGETEFNETLKCLEHSHWTKLHVFPFSLRKGTAAENLQGRVPDCAISERSKILRALSERRYQTFLESQIGSMREVLLERPSKKHLSIWLGHTENYLPTYAMAPHGEAKQLFSSRVTRVERDRVWVD